MRRRLAFGLATVLAVVAGVASASALTDTSGDDTPNGPELIQPDGRGASLPVTVADPDGGAAWAVRVYRSQAGWTCPEAGRIKDGNFGQVDSDGDFRPLDIEAAGSCADLTRDPMSLAVNHYPANGKQPARAAIFGVTTAKVTDVELRLPTGTRAVKIASNAFLAVVGDDALAGASLAARLADGSIKSYALRVNELPATEPKDPAAG